MKDPTDHVCGYMQSKSWIKDTLSRYKSVLIQYSHHSQTLQSKLTQHVSIFLFHYIQYFCTLLLHLRTSVLFYNASVTIQPFLYGAE